MNLAARHHARMVPIAHVVVARLTVQTAAVPATASSHVVKVPVIVATAHVTTVTALLARAMPQAAVHPIAAMTNSARQSVLMAIAQPDVHVPSHKPSIKQ